MDPITITQKDELALFKLSEQGPLGKRALFIFQYLFIRADFRDLVKELRAEFDIPPEGFDLSDHSQSEIVRQKYVDTGGFSGEMIFTASFRLDPKMSHRIDQFIEQCGVVQYSPNMDLAEGFISAIVREYILLNDFIGLYKNRFGLITVEQYDVYDREDENYSEKDVELRFSIPISVKRDEFKEYIDNIWDVLESSRKDFLRKQDQVRFRPRNNFVRDVLILNKYIELENLPKSKQTARGINYLDVATRKELIAEGHLDIPDEGSIRSIVSRLKREIKEKSAYWEEREPDPEPDPNYKPSDNDGF
jgi:hypothetical protein